jgi:hypothetical protein
MEAWTLILLSLIFLTISLDFSTGIPDWIVISCRAVEPAAGVMGPVRKVLQRHFPLCQFLLDDFDDSFHFKVVDTVDNEFLVLLIELDFGFGILQIKPRYDFFPRLLNRVQNFRHIDDGHHIKTVCLAYG